MKRDAAGKRPGRRESYHHGDLRQVLIDAAREEISANGAQSLSMASLARRAGVAQSAPYRHFTDREDLLAAVATDGFEQFTGALLEAAGSGDEDGAIKRMAVAYLTFGENNIELYRLMFASRLVPGASPDSPLRQAATAGFRPLLDRVAASDPKSSLTSARAKWGQLHGLVMLKADGFINEPTDALLDVVAL